MMTIVWLCAYSVCFSWTLAELVFPDIVVQFSAAGFSAGRSYNRFLYEISLAVCNLDPC